MVIVYASNIYRLINDIFGIITTLIIKLATFFGILVIFLTKGKLLRQAMYFLKNELIE